MKNFSVKDTVQRRKRQIIGCEKMFAKHISEKLFISEYKKNSQNSMVRKQTGHPIKNEEQIQTHLSKKIHGQQISIRKDA